MNGYFLGKSNLINLMKAIKVFILLFSFYSFTQEAIKPFGSLDGDWILDESFSDEFNKSKLDAEKWWDFNPAWLAENPHIFLDLMSKLREGC